MPYISPQQRAAGSRAFTTVSDDPHNGEPCDCDWSTVDATPNGAAWLRHRILPTPDQGRYGRATTDPPPYNTDGTPRRQPPPRRPPG